MDDSAGNLLQAPETLWAWAGVTAPSFLTLRNVPCICIALPAMLVKGPCRLVVQYNMSKESVSVYQERVEMSKTIATAVEKKASAAESASYE